MTWFCGVVCAVGAQRWLGVVGAGRWPADGLSSPGEARTNIRRRSSLAAPDWSTSSARRVCARRLQSERSATCVATAARRGAPMPCAVGATRPVLQAAAVCLCSGMSPCRRAGPARLSTSQLSFCSPVSALLNCCLQICRLAGVGVRFYPPGSTFIGFEPGNPNSYHEFGIPGV